MRWRVILRGYKTAYNNDVRFIQSQMSDFLVSMIPIQSRCGLQVANRNAVLK